MISELMRQTLDATGYLHSGDHLTRTEFLRIWKSLPNLKRAELIGGIVYMPSPVSIDHADMDNNVGIWVGTYRIATPGCASGSNTTALLLEDCPQPDVNLRVKPEYGGKSHVRKNLLAGAAELFAEVCYTTASKDLYEKFDLYEKAGVPEYLVVVVRTKQVQWHRLVRGKYKLILPDAEGVYRSHVFPGLWLDSEALFTGDMARVLATLQKGIDSEEHQHFVEELASRKRKSKR